ncbi:MAG: ATP-binding cassette domain-containing protein [Acidimicrobiia bacterium]|nr:ATP-binding cassette domain-containing protein [Acidimicrobiia bacterium]
MTGPPAFELSGVVAGPVERPILHDVSVDLPASGVTAVAGPSGSGKSSLLRLLNRLDDPISGEIRWQGLDVRRWEPTDLRRQIGMVFQRPPIFPGTVRDNLRVASPTLDDERAEAALAQVQLAPASLGADATTLSGGEAQRMCLARALLTQPTVVLADEPTASLDNAATRSIEELARVLADEGVAVIWVTHDTDQLRRIADHVLVLVEGRVASFGHLPEMDVHDDPLVRQIVGAP